MSDWDAVKQRADIVDLIGQYVSLQRAGNQYKARCPFHEEKTPSFSVRPDWQTFHCFGCGAKGDVFKFIERKENLSPVEALRLLAERYGVPLSQRRQREDEPATARMYEANEAAAQYFHHLLLNASAGEPARAYLARRGLDADTTRAFQLGYSLDAWDSLRDHLRERGFSTEEQLAAGLLTESERGGYDRFRGRLMFPIRDERGRVIGFGGRVLGDGVPKYLNTPQTPLFDKGGTLYALDRAKDAIRAAGAAVVVEGYMDVIAAHQHGITNVVATLGTAITERHVGLLKRYARQVVLAMDADAAGIEAALRGEELVRNTPLDADDAGRAQVVVDWRNLVRVQAAAPVEVRVFTVPQGKDPDEAIRADPAAFRALTERAVPPFEFRLRHELAAIDRENPRERIALADRVLPLVAAVADRTLRAQYLTQLAQATAIKEDELLARVRGPKAAARGMPEAAPLPLKEHIDRRPRRAAPDWDDAPLPTDDTDPSPAVRARGRMGGSPRTETLCLRLLWSYAGLRDAGLALEDDVFMDPANRALFVTWKQAGPEVLSEALDDAGREWLTRVLAERIPPFDEATAAIAFEDNVARLRLRWLEDRSRLMAAEVRDIESSDGRAAAVRAMEAFVSASPPNGDESAEAAARLLAGLELTRSRHALEVELRTRGVRGDSNATG